jgi:predicted DsbA family dithiol-disulfide isomerase
VRIEKLRRNFQVDVEWIHFPLHPETPVEGMTLEALFAGRDKDIDAMQARMKALMESEGLPYGERTHTYNSRLAQELGKWAEGEPGGEAIHDALYRAYFVEGLNLANPDVLVTRATSVGLSGEEARRVLEERRFKEAVDRDWARSKATGVRGIPTFACGMDQLVGAQPYEMLERFVRDAGASAAGG